MKSSTSLSYSDKTFITIGSSQKMIRKSYNDIFILPKVISNRKNLSRKTVVYKQTPDVKRAIKDLVNNRFKIPKQVEVEIDYKKSFKYITDSDRCSLCMVQ